jgi:hypothetical protein
MLPMIGGNTARRKSMVSIRGSATARPCSEIGGAVSISPRRTWQVNERTETAACGGRARQLMWLR